MAQRPDRYRNAVVPHIYVEGATAAIDFYRRAFGAEQLFSVAGPGDTIVHAELSIGGSVLMIGDPTNRALYGEPRLLGACTAGLHLMVDDNASLLARAVAAGAEVVQPVTAMFYGARSCAVRDPFGHVWVLLTWTENLEAAEIERRGSALGSS